MKNVHKGSHCWNLCSVNFTLLNCVKKYPLGLSLLEAEGKVFDCLVRPPTLKHVATIGDDVGDDGDDDIDDGDDDCLVRLSTLKHIPTIGENIGWVEN